MKQCLTLTLAIAGLILSNSNTNAQYTLTVACNGFDQFIGSSMHLRVTEGSVEVADVLQPILVGNPEYRLFCLKDTSTYQLEMFVDANNNQKYDGVETDPSWRLPAFSVVGVDKDLAMSFSDATSAITYSRELSPPSLEIWYAGYWYNQTYSTTGPSNAKMSYDACTGSIYGSLTVQGGAFGQPQPVTFNGSGPYDTHKEYGTLDISAPFSGSIVFDYGKVYGTISFPALNSVVTINGVYGADQIMYTYVISGAIAANGYLVMHKTGVNSVPTSQITSRLGTSFLASAQFDVSVNDGSGMVVDVYAVNTIGQSIPLPWVASAQNVEVQVRDLPVGLYTVVLVQKLGLQTVTVMVAH